MTDTLCIIGLDNSLITLKQKFGFAKNETVNIRPAIDAIAAHFVAVRHSAFGPRAYYEFIKNYL